MVPGHLFNEKAANSAVNPTELGGPERRQFAGQILTEEKMFRLINRAGMAVRVPKNIAR
jgi:hypothetical protein